MYVVTVMATLSRSLELANHKLQSDCRKHDDLQVRLCKYCANSHQQTPSQKKATLMLIPVS